MTRTMLVFGCCVSLGLLSAGTRLLAQTPERLSDKDVRALFEALDHDRDRFEDQLDGNLKHATLRSPRGELNVEQYLDDLQQNVKRLSERFTDRYSASNEVSVVLKQSSDIHRFIKSQPGELKGGSEWDRMANDLTRLAAAYGTTFPLEGDAPVRRMNDGDVASAAGSLASSADRLKKEIGRDKSMAPADRDALKRDLDVLKKQADVVRSRAGDGKPATAEARQMADSANKVLTGLAGKTLSSGSTAILALMRPNVETLAKAYGVAAPGTM